MLALSMLPEKFKAQAFVFNQSATGLFEKAIQKQLADFFVHQGYIIHTSQTTSQETVHSLFHRVLL